MNERVNRTCIGGVLTVVAVQPPSVDRNSGGHLLGVSQHVVDGADSTKGPRWVVLECVHDQIRRRGDASCGCIPRPVSKNGHGDVSAMTTVGIGGGRVETKLCVCGRYTTGQIGMILVQTGVGNGNHLTGTVECERGVVGNALNPGDGPCERIVDSKFRCGLCPQNSAVVGKMLNERASVAWFHHRPTHPSIARCLSRTELNDVCSECSVSTNFEIGGGYHGQGFCSGRLREKVGSQSPPGLELSRPAHSILGSELGQGWLTVSWKTYKPTLIVNDVQNGQVVLLHEGFEQVPVGTFELKQRHARVSKVMASSERLGHFGSFAKQRIKRPGCKANNTG